MSIRYHHVFFTVSLILISNLSMADLRQIPELNEVQLSLANKIQEICPQLGSKEDRTLNETGLFYACRAMIQTSNELQNSGDTNFSLGLSEKELRNALDDIAHEEVAVQGSSFTETSQSQFTNINKRLRSLRQGKVKLFSGLSLIDKRNNYSLAWLGKQIDDDKQDSPILLNSRFSYYLNGAFSFGSKEKTSREDGFDFNSSGLTLGADFRLGSSMFIGAALGYSRLSSDILDYRYANEFKNSGLNTLIYGTYYTKSIFFNVVYTKGLNYLTSYRGVPTLSVASPNDISFAGSELLESKTKAKTEAISLALGSDNVFSSFTFSHYGQINLFKVNVDAFDETGVSPLILHVEDESIVSTTSVLGMQLTHASSYSFGVMTALLRFEWHHEFDDKSHNIDAYYVYDPFEAKSIFSAPTDAPDNDYNILGVGLTFVLPKGYQMFAYYENILGLSYVSNHSVMFGLRKEGF